MSIGSFSSSLSGLKANQLKLAVIGNNLANMNTVGYKASQVAFGDLVSQTVSGTSSSPMQVGLGVAPSAVSANFSQGGIDFTGVATHVAIQGSGFFVVGDDATRGYTRAGNFGFDANGTLVTSDGRPVQGFTAIDPATGEIDATGLPGNIVVPPGTLRPPVPTTLFGLASNLNAAAAVGTTFTTSVPIYDALGNARALSMTLTKTDVGAWTYSITVPGEQVAGGVDGVPTVLADGTLTFDGAGTLTLVDGAAPANLVVPGPEWANGADEIDLTWQLVDAQGAPTVTSFVAPSATSSLTQNGAPAGNINGLSISATGEILASFGAGQVVAVGQLAVANFNNPQGLVKTGGNLLAESGSSGSANIGTAGTGGRGSLIGSSLEQSNVDIAQEFTQMILAQRGYQANSKGINVADELLVDALSLKR